MGPRRSAERIALVFGALLIGALVGAVAAALEDVTSAGWVAIVVLVPPALVRVVYRARGAIWAVGSLAAVAGAFLMTSLLLSGVR